MRIPFRMAHHAKRWVQVFCAILRKNLAPEQRRECLKAWISGLSALFSTHYSTSSRGLQYIIRKTRQEILTGIDWMLFHQSP